jgi:hypothetical protein
MSKVKLLIITLSFFWLNSANAGYDSNLTGTITGLYSYSSGLVLFSLSTQPTNHPTCNRALFALATDLPESVINRMYSRLLASYTTKRPINIGYDSKGNCGNGYIRVHRTG